MSTIAVTNLKHPSSTTNNLVLTSGGNVQGAGLDLITSETFSAVSSVSVNNCFSADYENYRILVRYIGSGTAQTSLRFRVGGSDNTTTNYNRQVLNAEGGTVGAATNASTQEFGFSVGEANVGLAALEIARPFLAETKPITVLAGQGAVSTAPTMRLAIGGFNASTSFDGFSLFPASGTITGTVRIYGYKD
jgi:hypothetical protein